jgi:hypothetical protein
MFQRKYRAARPLNPRVTSNSEYFERHKVQVAAINSPEAKKYLARLAVCRPTRPCHLWACRSCWMATAQELQADARVLFHGRPLDQVAWITGLLKPRDGIYEAPRDPKSDMAEIRGVFAQLRQEDPGLEIFALGRYELVFARRDSTPYLRSHGRHCNRSDVLVPHFHMVALFRRTGRYLSQRAVRSLLRPYFPGNRQLKVGSLRAEPSLGRGLADAIGYIVKGHTSSLRGSGLSDYVKFQTDTRTDAWFLKLPSSPAARLGATTTAIATSAEFSPGGAHDE